MNSNGCSTALGIAMAGWICTAVGWAVSHWLSLRAQRVNLRLQILDRARDEVTKELRAAQDWCGHVIALVRLAQIQTDVESQGGKPDWQDEAKKAISLLQTSTFDWISRLEEYEILFPESAAVRERLVDRQRAIFVNLSKLSSDLTGAAFGPTAPEAHRVTLKQARAWLDDVHDQAALLEDLAIHLQNESLSAITGRRIPARIPRDAKAPRIVRGKDGLLWIEPDKPDCLQGHQDLPERVQ